MRKGFALTLLAGTIAIVQVSISHATAPVVSNPGDVIIGDKENGLPATGTNIFVFPDAFNLDTIVTDDATPDAQIKWSFTGGNGNIRINGVQPLANPFPGVGTQGPSLSSSGPTFVNGFSGTLVTTGGNDPTSPSLANRIDLNDSDAGDPVSGKDANPRTVTFRNFNLTPNNTTPNFGPAGFIAGQTYMITLFASDCATYGQRTITVFTARNTSDALSGGGTTVLRTVDFTTTTDGWVGGTRAGFGGTVASGSSGLCMTVPGPGNNDVLWVSPNGYVSLVAGTYFRIRTTVSTDATAAGTIPLWFFEFDNFFGGNGNNYGGFDWILDVDGGAQGIGRPNGRTVYDFWAFPNAVALPQWDAAAFTAGADAVNDMRLIFEIIDANAALVTQNDAGTICIRRIEISSILRNNVQVESVVFNAPIDTSTHFPTATSDFGSRTSTIDNNTDSINVQLGTTGDVRVTMGFFNNSLPNLNQQLYPAVWAGNSLYRAKMRVRATAAGTNPVDAVFVAVDVTNSELGGFSLTTRSGGSVMVFAASPNTTAATYEQVIDGQNATSSLTPDANRIRPLPFFFNTAGLFGAGTGGDAMVVESITLEKLVKPN